MARPLRIEYAGGHYHVHNRGNAGERVLAQDRDKEKFLEYIAEAAGRCEFILHCYCLMDNHFHLLVETRRSNLSMAMQWLNVSYAAWYNRKHGRRGHVFQGRFKSYLIDADEYLTTLSRYIHLNPVRAGLVASPRDYAWSSYRFFMGEQSGADWLETKTIFEKFSRRPSAAKLAYKGFVEDVKEEDLKNPSDGAIGGCIIGGEDFVKWVQKNLLAGREEKKDIPQLKKLRPLVSIDQIIKEVGRTFGCASVDIQKSGKKKNIARDVAIYIARSKSGLSCKELGVRFGDITGAGVTMKYTCIKRLLVDDRKLAKKIGGIVNRIFNI